MEKYSNGDEYKGEFKDGISHGQGTYTWKNGDEYKGEFKDGISHGLGTDSYADGEKYEGQFKDGKCHGQGTLSYADGEKYEGQFKDGKRHGQGTLSYANGDKYAGAWEKNEYSGNGTWENGYKKVIGVFEIPPKMNLDDIPQGDGSIFYDDGTIFKGRFINLRPDYGVTYFNDGTIAEGEFRGEPSVEDEFYGLGSGTVTYWNKEKREVSEEEWQDEVDEKNIDELADDIDIVIDEKKEAFDEKESKLKSQDNEIIPEENDKDTKIIDDLIENSYDSEGLVFVSDDYKDTGANNDSESEPKEIDQQMNELFPDPSYNPFSDDEDGEI